MSAVHDVFHVSMLQKYIIDSLYALKHQVEITPKVQYQLQPAKMLDRKDKVLRNKAISLVKILWKSHSTKEAPWELGSEMQKKYPVLF